MADYEFDDSGIYSSRRPLEERWPPLGAAMDSSGQENGEDIKKPDHQKLRELEEEHEELNTSLISLTNHFAQVQFRLKQVVGAPREEREKLLLALEDFAFQGCPDVRGGSKTTTQCSTPTENDVNEPDSSVSLQKQKQDRLIEQLKQQLEEMERCVAEGASDSLGDEMDPEKLIEKQRVVLEQLKARTGLKLDGFDKMSDEDVRRNVDSALGQVMNPKTKEQLVRQLTSQIIDLEKFVKFLKDEVNSGPTKTETTHLAYPVSTYPIHVSDNERPSKDRSKPINNTAAGSFKRSTSCTSSLTDRKDLGYEYQYSLDLSPEDGDNGYCLHVPLTPEQARSKRIRDASLAIIRRALSILQIFAISQFGCTGKQIQDQILRKTVTVAVPGYFEFLSKLQASVENVARIKYALDQDTDDWSEPSSPRSPDSVLSRQNSRRSRASSVSSVDTAVLEEKFNYARDAELVNAVRKNLSMTLKDVMEHGLVRAVDNRLMSSKSLVACIVPTTRASLPQQMHVWELFNSYYSLKHGREFNSTPASRLSEAFGITLDGGSTATAKQSLLRTLHRIKTTHEPCRRSMDAMFKSLVCAGLNQKTLVQWCRIVTRTTTIVEEHYQSWAYSVKTGMSEALTYLERLQPFDFLLPEDLAIRHLTKINDAFGEP